MNETFGADRTVVSHSNGSPNNNNSPHCDRAVLFPDFFFALATAAAPPPAAPERAALRSINSCGAESQNKTHAHCDPEKRGKQHAGSKQQAANRKQRAAGTKSHFSQLVLRVALSRQHAARSKHQTGQAAPAGAQNTHRSCRSCFFLSFTPSFRSSSPAFV